MKNIVKYSGFVGMLFLIHCIAVAQTSNTGILTIAPGTIMSTISALDNKLSGDIVNDGDMYVYSHYNNDGLVSFTAGRTTGITRMRGFVGFQDVSGSIPMEWYDAEFNNSKVQPAFHQSNVVTVFGEVDFQKGIVDNDNHGGLLVFANNADHVNADDDSHVDGYVQKNGDNAFRLPIGDAGQYRYSAQSAPDVITDAFTGKFFFENPDALYPLASRAGIISLIDNAEYWTIDKTAGTSNIFLTLTWDEATTPASIYAAPYEEIHIVRWDSVQKLWVDEGGVADLATKEVTTIVDPLLGYGFFTLARVKVGGILPCGGRGVAIYNAVSPNDDGVNDYFKIDGIDACPQNNVQIYNRWGVLVYETNSYNTNGNVFKGISEGRATINKNEKLPTGTYFYIINFLDKNGGTRSKKAGYLYINDK